MTFRLYDGAGPTLKPLLTEQGTARKRSSSSPVPAATAGLDQN